MQLARMDRRYRLACGVGAAAAALLFTWVLLIGRAELADQRPGSDFYDAQARSLFDGRWDLPPEVLSIEAFETDGRSYTYFGPVPALLRMPVLAVTDRFDGRLTQPSMLGGFAVLMVGTSLVSWRTRTLLRPGRPVGSWESVLAGGFVFVVGAGSVALFLASQAVIYHEAILWGSALAVLSGYSLIGHLVAGSRRSLALASLFAALAVLTRASVGVGALVALAIVAGITTAGWMLGGRQPRMRRLLTSLVPHASRADLRAVLMAAVAVALPVVLYVAVNQTKFDTPYRLPLERQVFSDIDPARQATLADNGGSLFGVRFVPTTLWQSVRPDAFELDDVPPYVNFPRREATVIGDATFDTLDEASSATVTMPLLIVLGGVGLVVVFRPARWPAERALRGLRVPVLGATVGFGTALTIAFVAHRYLGDVLPFLVLTSACGFHVVARRTARAGSSTALVLGAAVVGVSLAVWGVAANLALAVEYQRLIAPADPATRQAFVAFQADVADTIGTLDVERADDVPPVAVRGTLVVVGDCDALLWSDGYDWYLLEGEVSAPTVVDASGVAVGSEPLCDNVRPG